MSSEDILQELKETYLTGIPNHLIEMESYILAMEEGIDYQENFEALYRKAHSLKGSGGTYGFTIITSVCHQMEDYITDALQEPDNIPPHAFDNIFQFIDILKELYPILQAKSEDFQDIEDRLKLLKNDALPQELNGLLVGLSSNMYSQICMQVFKQANTHCTTIEGSIGALQRMLHEHFDFVVTSKENSDLSGLALIAALKLHHKNNRQIKTILTTSNPPKTTCKETEPDFIVLKNKSFDVNLLNAIEEIKKDRQQ